MSRYTWILLGCLLAALGLLAPVLLTPVESIRWSGGFLSVEYRLTFLDADGWPVSGVTLDVRTRAGGVSHLYPVNEFLPHSTPTSDAHGQMVFHHVTGGPEFGGQNDMNVLGMTVRASGENPQYDCVFRLAGREVGRVRFNTLERGVEFDRLPRVTRKWKQSAWPTTEVIRHGYSEALRLRLYDGNGDGRLDREEGVASTYAFSSQWVEDGTGRVQESDVEFRVVERTITIARR